MCTSFLTYFLARSLEFGLIFSILCATGGSSYSKEQAKILDFVYRTARFQTLDTIFCRRGKWQMIYQDGHAIKALSFNNDEQVLFETKEYINYSSLGCSNDGSIISATDNSLTFLYIFVDTLSVYKLDSFRPRETQGEVYGHLSVMSYDGATFVLPGESTLISGPDILAQKKVIISGSQAAGWIGQQPYASDGDAGKLYSIDVDSGDVHAVLEAPARTVISGVARCFGEPFVELLEDRKDRGLIYTFREDVLGKRPFSKGEFLISNGESCIFKREYKNGFASVSDGLNLILYNSPNKSPDNDQEIMSGAAQLSGDGCWISSMVWTHGGNKNFIVVRNPFQRNACSAQN